MLLEAKVPVFWQLPYRSKNLLKQFSCSYRLVMRYAVLSFSEKEIKDAATVSDQGRPDTEVMGHRLRKECLI